MTEMAEDNATKRPNGVLIVEGTGDRSKDQTHDDLTLYTILYRLIAAIFFPGPNSSVPLSQRIKASLSDNVPLLRDASRNTAHHVLLWTRRGSPLRALLVVSVGTIVSLTLSGLFVFMLFFVAVTINAVVISLLISLVAAAGGFLALFFTCVAIVYVGALSVAVFVISTTTIYRTIAVLIATGTMENRCTKLANLNPTVQNWFVKVVVAEKTPIRTLKWGRQQRLVIVDKENDNMQCIIYEQDVDRLNEELQLYRTYVIGNGKIRQMGVSTPALSNKRYQIVLSRSTYIKPTSAHEELPLDHVYQLTPFIDCSQFVDFTDRHINLLCGVIHVFPPRFIQKIKKNVQEFVVVNDESRPMILTFWEEFIQYEGFQITENVHRMPIILGMRLSVNNYHGISVGTFPGSTILIDPPISQARKLESWLNANTYYVNKIVPQKLYEKEHQITSIPSESQIRKISQIICLPETVKSFWVKSTLQDIKPGQQFYFLGCPGCSKACGAAYGSEFTCFYCNNDYPSPKPMLRFEAELYDGTGCIDVFAEQAEAETLLHMSAEDIIAMEGKGNTISLDEINEKFRGWIGFFWTLWIAAEKSIGLAKHSVKRQDQHFQLTPLPDPAMFQTNRIEL